MDLRWVAMMTTYRRRWRMLDANGVLQAGVADDRVVARWVSGDAPLAWREIEIEIGECGRPLPPMSHRAGCLGDRAGGRVAGRLGTWRAVARRAARAAP